MTDPLAGRGLLVSAGSPLLYARVPAMMELNPDQLQSLQDMDILSGLTLPDETAEQLLRPLIDAGLVRQTHFITKGLYEYELTDLGREVIRCVPKRRSRANLPSISRACYIQVCSTFISIAMKPWLVILLLFVGCSSSPPEEEPLDFTGTWGGAISWDGNVYPAEFNVKHKGNDLEVRSLTASDVGVWLITTSALHLPNFNGKIEYVVEREDTRRVVTGETLCIYVNGNGVDQMICDVMEHGRLVFSRDRG